MSVAEAIDDEAITVQLIALAPGTTYDARGNAIVPTDPLPVDIEVAIQPASGQALRDLPEGLRDEVSYVAWSRTAVAVSNEIVYGEENLRVVHIWPRPSDGFTKFALKRVVG